jgi:LytS/YehU family sensor histidine kinase
VSLAMLVLFWGIAQVRRQVLERALTQARLEQERDAAARQAAQAQLRLLQGQIRPHFIFNTLSAVQHWVDTADPRGGPLLRALTAFLRGSTEALGKEDIRLADEVELMRHYLGVMQARLGPRLRFRLEVAPAAAAQLLPPGLLLTLVENAVEHGISRSLQGGDVALQADCADGWLTIDISDSAGLLPGTLQDGVGLANCRERLRHRYGAAASLELLLHEGRSVARLRLPLDAAGRESGPDSPSLPAGHELHRPDR